MLQYTHQGQPNGGFVAICQRLLCYVKASEIQHSDIHCQQDCKHIREIQKVITYGVGIIDEILIH